MLFSPKKLNTGKDLEKAFKMWNVQIYKYIFVRIQDKEISEEIAQEVFFKAWKSRELFNGNKSSLKNWLFVIATNLLRDHYRKNKKQVEEINENIPDNTDVSKDNEKQSLIDYIFLKIKSLSEKEQELIALKYKADLKIKDIAKIMDMNDSAVKVAIHRAVKKLQSLCKE